MIKAFGLVCVLCSFLSLEGKAMEDHLGDPLLTEILTERLKRAEHPWMLPLTLLNTKRVEQELDGFAQKSFFEKEERIISYSLELLRIADVGSDYYEYPIQRGDTPSISGNEKDILNRLIWNRIALMQRMVNPTLNQHESDQDFREFNSIHSNLSRFKKEDIEAIGSDADYQKFDLPFGYTQFFLALGRAVDPVMH